ncbi:AMP-binding protein [Aliikangiella maris]|uniref:AMP-binding protein n=2 Tax=Aliikangiella maris TaxID=3162458 RepID=A0ABV3MIX6_9GAMM
MNNQKNKPWLDYYPEKVSSLFELDEKSIVEQLAIVGDKQKNNIAYTYLGEDITYEYFIRRVDFLSQYLEKIGLAQGEKVFICLPNIPACPSIIFAALQIGATIILSNPLSSEDEHLYQVQDCGAKMAFVVDGLQQRFEKIAQETQLEHLFFAEVEALFSEQLSNENLSSLQQPVLENKKAYSFNDLNGCCTLASGKYSGKNKLSLIRDLVALDNIALMLYTGGTTGKPKAVQISHRNIAANVQQALAWLPHLSEADRGLALFPFFSGAGFTSILCMLMQLGASLVLIARPTPESIMQILQTDKISIFPGVPTIYKAILNANIDPPHILDNLNFCASGAAPLPAAIRDAWKAKTGQDIVEFYGMTEATAMMCGNPYTGATKDVCVGMPIPGTNCKIVAADDYQQTLAIGQIGEICIQGPQVAVGYYNRPKATLETFIDGWLLTGDLGYMDAEGSVFIVDRKKEMIISSGFNVYPREIDEVLIAHTDVVDVATVGFSDDYRGESIRAYIVAKNQQLTAEILERYCREKLAVYKVPKQFVFVDSLPKNPLGKVVKRLLPAV